MLAAILSFPLKYARSGIYFDGSGNAVLPNGQGTFYSSGSLALNLVYNLGFRSTHLNPRGNPFSASNGAGYSVARKENAPPF